MTRACLATVRHSRVYQGTMMRRMIEQEGFGADEVPDLLYVNMKETDLTYHAWGWRRLSLAMPWRHRTESFVC